MTNQRKPKASSLADDSEEIIAAALNEHGFLLQQVIRQKLGGGVGEAGDTQDGWRFRATECAVTAADGSQTRIDLLLQNNDFQGVHICMECKRPNPKFKKWVFFDRESNVAGMKDWRINVETLLDGKRYLAPLSSLHQVPLFTYYVEAAVKRDGSTSSTEAIEKAFYQLMKGQSGLMAKFESSNVTGFARSIPLVVTTAELVEAKFDPMKVSIETGTIAAGDLELVPMPYCAVNYRADDSLALPMLAPPGRSEGFNDLIISDIINAQIRTVFVVRATVINKFLNWASSNLLERT
jgi:hypothetical protein